jgi:hypothetical protein
VPTSEYRPAVEDIGALLRQRTVDGGGNEVGTFDNVSTRPSADEVEKLIDDAMDEVYPAFGENIPDAPGDPSSSDYDADAIRRAAKSAVKFDAAALVELTHFGKEVARGNSPYEYYLKRYQDLMKSVSAALNGLGGDEPGGNSMYAEFGFPLDAGGMVGWGTKW